MFGRAVRGPSFLTPGRANNAGEAVLGDDTRVARRSEEARLRAMVDEHVAFIWRLLRRLGVPAGDVDDASQRVFLVASEKLDAIAPGRERSFLFGTALNVAANVRRSSARLREVSDEGLGESVAPGPDPDVQLDLGRARAIADAVLNEMPLELRAVFVLFEVEEMSTAAIAELLQVPVGTVASRLRRAREDFQQRLKRFQVRAAKGVTP
jgi:RNA polymerase sigma-70 factor, ECF subfamily